MTHQRPTLSSATEKFLAGEETIKDDSKSTNKDAKRPEESKIDGDQTETEEPSAKAPGEKSTQFSALVDSIGTAITKTNDNLKETNANRNALIQAAEEKRRGILFDMKYDRTALGTSAFFNVLADQVPKLFQHNFIRREELAMDLATLNDQVLAAIKGGADEKLLTYIVNSMANFAPGLIRCNLAWKPEGWGPLPEFDGKKEDLFAYIAELSNSTVTTLHSLQNTAYRLWFFLRLACMPKVLVRQPKKWQLDESTVIGEATAQVLGNNARLFGDANQHLAFAVRDQVLEWWRLELLQMFTTYPVQFNEPVPTTTMNGVKTRSKCNLPIDQMSAELINLCHNFYIQNQTRPERYVKFLAVYNIWDQMLLLKEARYETNNTLMMPSDQMLRNYMFHFFLDGKHRSNAINRTYHMIKGLGLYTIRDTTPLAEITQTQNSTVNNVFGDFSSYLSSVDVDPERLIAFECFAANYEFRFIYSITQSSHVIWLQLLHILLFMVHFPNIAAHGMAQLSTIIAEEWRQLFPTSFGEAVAALGCTYRWNGQVYQRTDATEIMLTDNDVRRGIVPFWVVFPGRVNTMTWLLNQLTNRQLPQIELTRKRNAGYPYLHENYVASLSHHELPIDTGVSAHTAYSGLANTVVRTMSALRKHNRDSTFKTMKTDVETSYSQVETHYIKHVGSMANVTNVVMPRLQRLIKESLPFVHRNENLTRNGVPTQDFRFASGNISQQFTPGYTIQRQPMEIDLNEAAIIMLSVEGTRTRDIVNSPNTDLLRILPTVNMVEEVDADIAMVYAANKLAYANWLRDQFLSADDRNSIFHPYADELRPMLNVTTSNRWLSSIDEQLGTNLIEIFQLLSENGSGVDPRATNLTLYALDEQGETIPNVPGTVLGHYRPEVNGLDREYATVAGTIALNKDSALIQKERGIIFGLEYLPDLDPFSPYESSFDQGRIILTRENFVTINNGNTVTYGLQFMEDGEMVEVSSPMDPALRMRRLVVRTAQSIPITHLQFVLLGIKMRAFALEVIEYLYDFMTTDLISSHQYQWSHENELNKLENLLRVQDGSFAFFMFYTTVFADLTLVNEAKTAGYVRLINPLAALRDTTLLGGVYGHTERPRNFIPPDADHWSFGRFNLQGKQVYPTNPELEKRTFQKPNWNNQILTVNTFEPRWPVVDIIAPAIRF